jgi:hypothetical protein
MHATTSNIRDGDTTLLLLRSLIDLIVGSELGITHSLLGKSYNATQRNATQRNATLLLRVVVVVKRQSRILLVMAAVNVVFP